MDDLLWKAFWALFTALLTGSVLVRAINNEKEKKNRKAIIDSALIELTESKVNLKKALSIKQPNPTYTRIIFAIDGLEKIYESTHEFKFNLVNKMEFTRMIDYLRKTKGETSRATSEVKSILIYLNDMEKFINKAVNNNYYFDSK